jgi:alpha-1,3-rhamnosyl/mannosyltransferase
MRFVLDARYAARLGGIGTYVRAVGSRIAAMNAGAHPLRFWTAVDSEPISSAPGVTHHHVRRAAASLATLLWPAHLDRLHRDDVFHAPANILGFGLPCRTILTLHDTLWLTRPDWCQPNRLARPFSRRYFKLGIHHGMQTATRIITVSHASADGILQCAPSTRERLVVIPNAADPEFRPPEARTEAARRASEILGFHEPYFLVLGQHQESKGHTFTLAGFAAMRSNSARLVFVQRLNRGGALFRMADELGVADRVSFLGALSKTALIPVMQSALALVYPSLSEGFGIPTLEAMSVGCPVIASDIPSLREVLAGAGMLVPPACASAITSAMQRVYDEPALREELRGRGLERAPAFSWDKTAALTHEVYRDMAR